MAGKSTRVVMPQLGESVHEGTISKWLVKVGDKVVEFEPMLEVDTDKVNAEVPAPVTGILREILAKEGETVQAGAEIAVVEVGTDGSDGKVTATPEEPAPARAAAAPKAEPQASTNPRRPRSRSHNRRPPRPRPRQRPGSIAFRPLCRCRPQS
jgi:2-oxoisovalerate dehydrogenase E2 component (dihydrolipoyl transacylase)